ncbi:hypothetical protein AHAS_Ahas03G0205800 [Arachis hypogaea]
MGMPLGVEGMACQLPFPTWACHLSLRRGTQASSTNKKKAWACHLSFKAWHAKSRRPWACHLCSGRATPQGTKRT